ncbi:MAG: hypothetical protein CSA81_01005 [Acidobacteria bacterium]|nr:MAG: hypothetical protein CSA81_01005 [Acidobacteriota bacterium]PIE90373.1 MAG: hypothetical protein CR997_06175 [Acidobacteriota bacterium]
MTAIKPVLFPKIWNRLDQYIFSEIHPPFLMAMLIYNGIFFIKTFTNIASMAGEIQLPISLFFFLFFANVPEVLYITLPISFLFASQAAFSRMSSDSEIIAPLSTGVSFWRLSRPVLAYGLFLALFAMIIANWLEPNMARLADLKYQNYLRSNAIPNLTPGVITTLGKKDILYVDRMADQTLLDLIYISNDNERESVTFAKQAEFIFDDSDGWSLELKDANIKIFSNDTDRAVETASYHRLKRDFPNSKVQRQSLFEKPESTMDSWQLYKAKESGLRYRSELYSRIWLALTCLVFAFYAAPLSAKHSRLGGSSSFGISLFLIASYMLMFQLGEDMVEAMHPALALGLTPLLFLGFGLFLQLGKHLGWGAVFHKAKDRWSTWLRSFKKKILSLKLIPLFRKSDMKKSKRVAYTSHFPTKIDRYVTRFFIKTYALVQTSVLALILLIEYSQLSSSIKKNQIDTEVVLKCMAFRIPDLVDTTIFFCLLITVLVVFALMSKSQEITAIRAGGGSLQRVCLPLILLGMFASLSSYYIENLVLPWSNRNYFSLKNMIKHREPTLFTRDVWIKTGKDELLNFKFFDKPTRTLHDAVTYVIDTKSQGLTNRKTYQSLKQDPNKGWVNQSDTHEWDFSIKQGNDENMQKIFIPKGQIVPVGLKLSDLDQKKRRPSEFSIEQLKDYVAYLRARGYNSNQFYTALLAKMAQPALPLIMMLLAMPMGFQFGRRGSFYGLGLGILVGLSFWVCFELSKKLGASGALPPSIAAWGVICVFSVAAIYRFAKMGQ